MRFLLGLAIGTAIGTFVALATKAEWGRPQPTYTSTTKTSAYSRWGHNTGIAWRDAIEVEPV